MKPSIPTLKYLRCSLCLIPLLLLFVAPSPIAAARPNTRSLLQSLGGVPCPHSIFTCVTLTVPLDHFNPSDTRTLDVVFAVLPASGTRKGMFVTVTGGPGTAGISYADSYLSYNVPEIPEKFDVVFFDQRGVGLSGGLDCFRAASKFYQTNWSADTPAHIQHLKTVNQTFADNCDTQMHHPEILPYLSTAQAVEDLEQFRQLIGDDKFWIYGESYGTQYVQTYARSHPEHLGGMILDGTVDLTPDGITYYEGAAHSFSNTLVASLAQCQTDARCAADFGIRPLRAYDQLAKLLSAKQMFTFPLANGSQPARNLGPGDLDTIAEGQMYSQPDRMMFVRALAKYTRDRDFIPLARLFYPNVGIDETTLKPTYDPSYSDAYYYAVECQDYGYFTGTNDSRANQYITQVNALYLVGVRLTGLLWGDLPCVYWRGASQNTSRPSYLTAPGVPALVLNAVADPITPIAGARAVYQHLDNAYLITQDGGPHVIWERGVPCIDNPVNAFLVSDTLPAQRETECPGQVMDDYVPLPPADARSFASPLKAMQSAETEINYLPEYQNWDFATPGGAGCGANGTLQFAPDNARVKFTLQVCAFTKGFEMTGNGTYDFNADRFTLNVIVSGEQTCRLVYERVGAKTNLKGSCNGSTVQLFDNAPSNLSRKTFKPRVIVPRFHPR